MEINEFIKKIADQFDGADASALTAKTVFRDIENWSSLVALSIIAMVDEEYNVQLKGNEMKNAVTIEDLYNIVISRS